MTVSEDRVVLSLIWKKATCDLTDEAFKTEALNFIEIVKELQSKKVLAEKNDTLLSYEVPFRGQNYPGKAWS